MYFLGKVTDMALDGLAWSAARSAVDAVRYQPAHMKLLMACGASQADGSHHWLQGVAGLLARPGVARGTDIQGCERLPAERPPLAGGRLGASRGQQ